LAWNIGTTGRTVVSGSIGITAPFDAIIEWIIVERCEYSTPFGLPVVPEV
jgi:hypothetical protein